MEDCYLLLLAAIIKQAMDDGLELKSLRKILKNTVSIAKRKELRHKLTISRDGDEFMRSVRLENICTHYCMPINPVYLREKYIKLYDKEKKIMKPNFYSIKKDKKREIWSI